MKNGCKACVLSFVSAVVFKKYFQFEINLSLLWDQVCLLLFFGSLCWDNLSHLPTNDLLQLLAMLEPLQIGIVCLVANPARDCIAFVIYVAAYLSAFMEMLLVVCLHQRDVEAVTHQRVTVPYVFVWELQCTNMGGQWGERHCSCPQKAYMLVMSFLSKDSVALTCSP